MALTVAKLGRIGYNLRIDADDRLEFKSFCHLVFARTLVLAQNMQPVVVSLQSGDDPQDAIHRAVAALAVGRIVAIPTETVYGFAVSALNAEAVKRLMEIKCRLASKAFALAVKSAEDVLDYVPEMTPLARRFARRCWPGPVTLVLDDAHRDSVIFRLPPDVQHAVLNDGLVGFRVPANDIALRILRLTVGPLVLTSANVSGQPDATDANSIDETVRSKVDLIVDTGPCRFGQSSSVVKVQNNHYTVLREGVVARAVIQQLSQFMVLIVCTGNTCRSPMAERILQRQVAARLGCPAAELFERGIKIISAGIAAFPGGRPSREAIEIMAERGLELGDHSSQPLTERLVRHADLILTMTAGHRQAVISQWPDAAQRTFLVMPDQQDISDPIGQPISAYARCAEEIEEGLKSWVDRIQPPDLGQSG